MSKIIKKAVAFVLTGVLLIASCSVPVRAENALEEETVVASGFSNESDGPVMVDAGQIGFEDFLWPNEYGQYEVSVSTATEGRQYMLIVLNGVYRTIAAEDSDVIVGKMLYIDQEVSGGGTLSFSPFIPAQNVNATVVVSGEDMSPTIVGYISRDIYRFGKYSADEAGKNDISDTVLLSRDMTIEEVTALLPQEGYVHIYSDILDNLKARVRFTWDLGEVSDILVEGSTVYITGTAESADNNFSGFESLLAPIEINAYVMEEHAAPMTLTASKTKQIYRAGETLDVSDVTVKAVYTDGTIRQVTGWESNASSIDMLSEGNKVLTISFEGLSTNITICVAGDDASEFYTVCFDTRGGNLVPSEIVSDGGVVTRPEDPVKKGYTFIGWFTDSGMTHAYDFSTAVSSDMTLYAGWLNNRTPRLISIKASVSKKNYMIGEEFDLSTVKVTASYSDGIQRDVTDFTVDHTALDMSTAGSKRAAVSYMENGIVKTSYIDIYVREEYGDYVTYTVSFDTGCDVQIESVSVLAGDRIGAPAINLERAGNVFAGWYYGDTKWDFAQNPVNSDMILKARWLKECNQDGIVCYVDDDTSFAYTGKKIMPAFVIMDSNGNVLKKGRDYSIKYTNNQNVSTEDVTASAAVTARGNYVGTITIPFVIRPIDIASDAVSCTYTAESAESPKGIAPVPVLQFAGKKLKSNKDFSVSYMKMDAADSENSTEVKGKLKDAGVYRIVLEGSGNYVGQKVLDYRIYGTDYVNLAKAAVKLSKGCRNIVYTGQEVSLIGQVSVKYKGRTLTEGTDYLIEYLDDHVSVGRKKAVIKAVPESAQYFGAKSFTYEIKGLKISSASVRLKEKKVDYGTDLLSGNIDSVRFKTNASSSEALNACYGTAYSKGMEIDLVEGRDYSVKYMNATKPGNAYVTLTGTGIFSGTKKVTYKVNALSIKSEGVTARLLQTSVRQDKAGAKPGVSVTVSDGSGSMVLEEGVDYKLSYVKNTYATSQAAVKITGTGSYKDSVTLKYTITPKSLVSPELSVVVTNPVKASKPAGYTYKPSVAVYDNGVLLKANADYTVDYSGCIQQSDVSSGTIVGYIMLTGKNSYTGERRAAYKIVEKSLGKSTISIADQEYTGYAVTLDTRTAAGRSQFKAAYTDNVSGTVTLTPGVDFVVDSYRKNTKAGKATAVLRGIGNYSGTKTVTFNIVRKQIQ